MFMQFAILLTLHFDVFITCEIVDWIGIAMIKLHILSMTLGGMMGEGGGGVPLQENFMTHSLPCNYDCLFTSQNPYSTGNHYTRCTVTTCLS